MDLLPPTPESDVFDEWDLWDAELEAARTALSTAPEQFTSARPGVGEILADWEHAVRQVTLWQGVQTEILARAFDEAMDASAGADPALEVRSIAAELACAVAMSDRTIEQHMSDAVVLRDRFPRAYGALRSGTLSRAHAQVIADEGIRLIDDDVRAVYELTALDRRDGLTTARLRAVARAIAEQLIPTTIDERHAEVREERRVTVREAADGMAELWALLPAPLAYGLHDRLTQMARIVKRGASSEASEGEPDAASPGDDRTLDQIRADVLCDVLLTGHATAVDAARDGIDAVDAIRANVQITVPVMSLIGGSCDGGAGVGGGARLRGAPIDLDTARRLVGAASMWERVLTDPVTGDVVAVDRRFPTEPQRRFLRARDEHCRFPGCRVPVTRCDADHTIEFQHGGATEVGNLAHLCRRHHTLKGTTAWQVTQRPGGVLEWTSPRGRTYIDRPPPVLRHGAGVVFA